MSKPDNWADMSTEEQKSYARTLINSGRGQYILAQALHVAIKNMKAIEPSVRREVSNIEDMEILESLFGYAGIFTTLEKVARE